MEQPERDLNVEQLRKCARYFRALAAVPETTATAMARQRTIDRLVLRVIGGRRVSGFFIQKP